MSSSGSGEPTARDVICVSKHTLVRAFRLKL
jgi:hypothetical protein